TFHCGRAKNRTRRGNRDFHYYSPYYRIQSADLSNIAIDRYALAYTPKCTNGKPYSLDDSFPRTQLGKSCKDNFCPSNFTCHDGDIFAYCC
uniref:WAP domain-containing protein n=1 Tax=Angiostrongylus cantonensis TaxID=6313 RepID=A0A0K0DFF6_ANGCA